MKMLFFFLFLPSILLSQDVKTRLLDEKKMPDSTVVQIVEFIVQNNTSDRICISISPDFLSRDISKDTIQLAASDNKSLVTYDLGYTKNDTQLYAEPTPRYPLIVNRLTSFVLILKIIKTPIHKDARIEFSYLNIPNYKYEAILERIWSGDTWGDVLLKIQKKTVDL